MMLQIVLLILGVLTICFIGWWFFGEHDISQALAVVSDEGQKARVIVEGGYTPSLLKGKAGQPLELIFHRKDPSTCLEKVIFPELGVEASLPLFEDVIISIDTSRKGEITYTCGMHMYHGNIIIE